MYSFVYLDSRINKDLPLESTEVIYDVSKPAVVTVVNIQPVLGTMKKNILLDTKYVNGKRAFSFSNDKIIPTSSNEFLMEMYRKKAGDFLIRVKYFGN